MQDLTTWLMCCLKDLKMALKRMKSGKAVGPDGIPGEIWKLTGRKVSEWLQCMFNKMLLGDKMSEEWRESCLVPIFKGKGDVQECKN